MSEFAEKDLRTAGRRLCWGFVVSVSSRIGHVARGSSLKRLLGLLASARGPIAE